MKLAKEYLEVDSTGMYDLFDHYERSIKNTNLQMDELIRKGEEVPDFMFDLKIGDLEGQKEQAEDLIDFFNGLIDQYGEENPEWAKGWQTIIDGLREQVSGLDEEIDKTTEDKQSKPLVTLQNQLVTLKREGNELNKILDDPKKIKSAKNYTDVIMNLTDQQNNLSKQIAEVEEKMSKVKNHDSDKYQNL